MQKTLAYFFCCCFLAILLFDSCKRQEEVQQDASRDLIISLRWSKGYPAEDQQAAQTGLVFFFSRG